MVLFWYQNKFDNQSDFMKHISNNTIAKNLMLQVAFDATNQIPSRIG